MNFLSKMERKWGRYAIRNLTWVLIGGFVIGYLLMLLAPGVLNLLALDPYMIIHHLQIWRIVTWLIIPPSSFSIWTIVMLFFYFNIGTTLERMWGAFRYNVFVFLGIVLTIVSSFILYFVYGGISFLGLGSFSTYYICLSLFLGYAMTFPNAQVLLMFIIPIKMKYISILYLVMAGFDFVRGSWVTRTSILCSLAAVVIFFIMGRTRVKFDPEQMRRHREFKKAVSPGAAKKTFVHKCAVCGRTELDHPELEFRYCSKCKGNYEYCQDHLFTHEHKK